MDVAGRTGCSPTVTATFGCDFKACLEVNNMTSVFATNVSLLSTLRIKPKIHLV